MGCRCNERREALTIARDAIAKGDTKTAAEQTVFVVRSTVEDTASAFRQSVALAKSRLMRK
jgi:hypothetical protein